MRYKVYYTKLRKTPEKVNPRDADSPHVYQPELVYVGMANSMAEAKRITAVPVLEEAK
jgi:hypothetical protein